MFYHRVFEFCHFVCCICAVFAATTFVVAGEILNGFPDTRRRLFEKEDLIESLCMPSVFSDEKTKVSREVFDVGFWGIGKWARVPASEAECLTVQENASALSMTLFSKTGQEASVQICWHRSEREACEGILNRLMMWWNLWSMIPEVYSYSFEEVGDYALLPKEDMTTTAHFYRKNAEVCVRFNSGYLKADALELLRSIDALLCGNAEFLPAETAEFVEIRAEWEREKERRREREREQRRRWHEKALARERAERLAEAERGELPLFPIRERSMSDSGIKAFRESMKARGVVVPATGTCDASAWRKLTFSRAMSIFDEWESQRDTGDNHPLWFELAMRKARGSSPVELDFDEIHVEVIHAQTPDDARSWAAYFRFKYMSEEERSKKEEYFCEDDALPLARATCVNAFPNLGDENISWRGFMDSSFLPEEKTNETQIIFIRGTSVVSVKSARSDFSALPFARALDALLLGEDEHKAGCLISPQM